MAPVTARHPDADLLVFRHQKVQRLRRLLSRRSARQADGVFVVEGAKVLGVALDAGVVVESVYVGEPSAHDDPVVARALDAGVPVYELAPGVIDRVADTVTPQPVMAVVRTNDVALPSLRGATMLVVAVDVRDPGNAGTLLRSAGAAGAGGVVFCDGSVDVFNPKTVRASAGSLFHVPVVAGGAAVAVLDEIAGWGVHRLGTIAAGGLDYADADLTAPVAFVLGNEAHGLDGDTLAGSVDGLVTIPMDGRAESLNVGVAAAVLCFEAARQRRQKAAA
ncbi:MAG: methyltransferase, TrmH family [Actinomycetota bacterium]|nr:methyltransferase, TrmH family [Actinomycetota bacterium]